MIANYKSNKSFVGDVKIYNMIGHNSRGPLNIVR